MKYLFLCFSLAFFMSYSLKVQAQLSKKELKEWKTRMKKMDPEEFKGMFEENSALRGQVNSLKGQVSSLQSRISDKDAKITELTDEIRELENQLTTAQAQPAPVEANTTVTSEAGVVFKVQIGAFRNKDLSKYFENHENFSGETDPDGVQKVTLGIFRDYWEADTFKKYLREMGVKDAWIVPYKDGTRVPMKDVLEGVI
jgi:TolA-binding protein